MFGTKYRPRRGVRFHTSQLTKTGFVKSTANMSEKAKALDELLKKLSPELAEKEE